MDKIKINLRYKTFNEITDECLRLEFLKSDGTPNKNAYICTLLMNFYPYLSRGAVKLKVDKIFNDENVSDNRIFIEPIKESISTFESISNLEPSKSLSTTIRDILEKFYTLESDERERIILSKPYDYIEQSIKHHEEIIITTYNRFSNKGFQYHFDPYKIVQTKDRIFNYVFGRMYGNEVRLICVKLLKIKLISDAQEKITFTKEEVEKFDEEIKTGAPFFDVHSMDVVVKFTKEGLKTLNLAYKNRPFIKEKSEDTYTFKSSEYNAMIYFPQFGKDAKILSPNSLKEKMNEFFKDAVSTYNYREILSDKDTTVST